MELLLYLIFFSLKKSILVLCFLSFMEMISTDAVFFFLLTCHPHLISKSLANNYFFVNLLLILDVTQIFQTSNDLCTLADAVFFFLLTCDPHLISKSLANNYFFVNL
eukprot:TRINITY_DN7382_c0_g1_i3.p1 TRINITY_DN7382_c0_g1~~TRINITY_DN7382_c0_g1_i3.p1  ORF type:complete len:107 (+),score=1.51 TRINITY_DN7382_c0_g1_i3:154-474(+)